MDSFCPVVEGSTVSAHQCLTLGAILRAFLTALLPLLKLGKHKLRVLWRLAVCGTPALAPIFLLVPTARIGIGRHAPVGTGIVRAAWPPKAANGSKNKPRVSSRSLTSIASSLYRQNLIPWSWPTSADFTPCSLSAPHRACWSLGATDSKAIWELPPSCIPGDKSSTSIPIFTALSLPEL